MTAARGAPGGGLRVGVSSDGVKTAVSAVRLAEVARVVLRAEGVRDALLSVILLSRSAMARLNRRHLGHAGSTDVISFGFAPGPGVGVVGDVYICPEVARRNAKIAGCGVREELVRLVIPGTLHVLGWDHPGTADRTTSPMWVRQERLLAAVARRSARRA